MHNPSDDALEEPPKSLFSGETVRDLLRSLSAVRSAMAGGTDIRELGPKAPANPNTIRHRVDEAGRLLALTYEGAAQVPRTDVNWSLWVYNELLCMTEPLPSGDPLRSLPDEWRQHLERAFGTIAIVGC